MSYITLNTTTNNINVSPTEYKVTISPVGLPGTPGSVWRTFDGIPDDSVGINNDYGINTITNDVYQKIDGHYELVYSFTNLIDDTKTDSLNHTWSSRKLQTINNRVTELEQRTFQQSTTPTTGVNAGDIWLDTSDDTLKVYREYPFGSGNFRWEPLIYKLDDDIDGGAF